MARPVMSTDDRAPLLDRSSIAWSCTFGRIDRQEVVHILLLRAAVLGIDPSMATHWVEALSRATTCTRWRHNVTRSLGLNLTSDKVAALSGHSPPATSRHKTVLLSLFSHVRPRDREEHWSAPGAASFYQRVGRLMRQDHRLALLLFSAEWQSPGDLLADALDAYDVDVNRTLFVYGGMMHPAWPHDEWGRLWRRPRRLREAYFKVDNELFFKHANTRSLEVRCAMSRQSIVGAIARRAPARNETVSILAAGHSRAWRGAVLAAAMGRGLLSRALFSATSYEFCTSPPEPTLGFLLRYVTNATAVRALCAQLPRSIDRTGAHPEFTVGDAAFGNTTVALTMETSFTMPWVFNSEKPLKPMFAMRPFALLCDCGCLSHLRWLGFRTFRATASPLAQEDAHDQCDAHALEAGAAIDARLHAVLDAVEAAADAPAATWSAPAVVDVLEHNVRHLACPAGFRAVVARHALTCLRRALAFGPLAPFGIMDTRSLPTVPARSVAVPPARGKS